VRQLHSLCRLHNPHKILSMGTLNSAVHNESGLPEKLT
jgi:hypothetical protein